MTDVDLNGWVVVVAGDEPALAEVAGTASAAGAAVAVVSTRLDEATQATVRFRADPRDPDAWERIAMHVEQHLGPIDGVVTDESASATVQQVFATDLMRRGRSAVLVMAPSDSGQGLVTALARRPPATPSPPGRATPDR